VVPTLRTDIITVTGVLVVLPGLTSSATENSTWWYKVEMTNTVAVTSEVVHIDLRTISLYAVLGLSDLEFTLLPILIFTVTLSGILLSRKASSHQVVDKRSALCATIEVTNSLLCAHE
jgi:hypothetical protein